MSKWNTPKEEVQDTAWKPSARDASALSEKLKGYEKREVNGRMQYPFELHLEHEGIISFGQEGYLQVRNPLAYHRANETNDLRTWIAEREMEKLFQNFPGEREAFEEKRRGWVEQVRASLSLFKGKTQFSG